MILEHHDLVNFDGMCESVCLCRFVHSFTFLCVLVVSFTHMIFCQTRKPNLVELASLKGNVSFLNEITTSISSTSCDFMCNHDWMKRWFKDCLKGKNVIWIEKNIIVLNLMSSYLIYLKYKENKC